MTILSSRRFLKPAGRFAFLLFLGSFAFGDTPPPPATTAPDTMASAGDLTSLTLEQLAAMEVTSVSRKPERQSTAAAAVFVITADDIRRAGATTIADALRLAPGVEVSQINSSQMAIGIRGFESRLSRAVLVLIDGRTVYSPLFAGTYWEIQDTLLEDIERIEVIRGPGGTLWGDNAVNGVINIITKSSKATQGTYLMAGAGSQETAFGAMRYGGKASDNFTYRFYGKYSDRAAEFNSTGDNFDAWHIGQTGFRTDWDPDASNNLTVQGDLYDGKQGERSNITIYSPPFTQVDERDGDLFGANILSRWKHQLSNGSDLALQTYYDRTDRKDPNFSESRNTYDLDFQHHIPLTTIQDFIWGFDYRLTGNHIESLEASFFDPPGRTLTLGGLFAQDAISLIPQTLVLTLGSKVEHNDYSGWEYQPNGRLAWTPDEKQTIWSAVSRAVRTPSATDRDLSLTASQSATSPTFATVSRSDDFESEDVIAYELGYRVQPVEPLFLDLSTFYNHYNSLESIERGTPFIAQTPAGPSLITPYTLLNGLKGQDHGIELASTYFVTKDWKLRANYSFLSMSLAPTGGSNDVTSAPSENGSSPRHQVELQSLMSLPHGVEFDPTARYVDVLPAQNDPSYWSCDVHLGWHMTKFIELSVVGQNLLQTHHPEFGTLTQIERSVYGQISYRSW